MSISLRSNPDGSGTLLNGSTPVMEITAAGVVSLPNIAAGSSASQPVNFGQINVANSAPIKTALNASGDAPIYACRAWVNFNGTGTVAIRASGNVSSITDNDTGYYSANFITAMPDSLASIVASSVAGGGSGNKGPYLGSISDTSASIVTYNSAGSLVDSNIIDIAVFR